MKKIISILLALISVLSLFAVTASARALGDVNGDGATNSVDALQILNYAVGNPTTINEKYADVNGDGAINSSDALVILTISVGSYTEPTNVDLVPEVIAPVFASGKYTLTMTISEKDNTGAVTQTPVTIMVDGNKFSFTTQTEFGNTRLFVVDGVIKIAFSDHHFTVIVPKEYLGDLGFDSIDFGDLDLTEGTTYVKSRYVTEGGKTYTVDRYKSSDSSFCDYYFLNGSWVKSETLDASGTVVSTRTITEFKKGVDVSYFKSVGIEMDLDTIIGLAGGMEQ